MKFSHVVLCMNDFSNNLLSHPTFLSTISLSHKCKRLRDLVPLPFPTSTFNFMNERFSSFNVRFLYITSVIVYILISQNVKRRERESVRLWKKKRKNIEDNIKEKKIIAICAILHAECLMLTQKKKKNAICAILHAACLMLTKHGVCSQLWWCV